MSPGFARRRKRRHYVSVARYTSDLNWYGRAKTSVEAVVAVRMLYAGRDELAYECETAAVYVNLYHWRYSDFIAQCKTIATELQFEVPIINPDSGRSARIATFAGKIDALIKLPDGRIAVLEHKTTSGDIKPESAYWKRLRVDTQIARYVIASRHLGYQIDTVWYDVIAKPSLRAGIGAPLLDDNGVKIVLDANGERVRTKDGKKFRETGSTADGYVLQTRPETPDEWRERLHAAIIADVDGYFSQREIPRTDAEIDEARRDLWDHAQVVHQCDKEGRWPRNSSACVGYYQCQYLDLCSANLSPNDDTIPEGFVRVDTMHTELNEVA
jgi:hypothetical protein